MNVCEQCDNLVPAPDALDILTTQLDDINAVRVDAETRGWHDEAARHTGEHGALHGVGRIQSDAQGGHRSSRIRASAPSARRRA